jgi:RNA polymerase sigma-70 factor, ECF subfamily
LSTLEQRQQFFSDLYQRHYKDVYQFLFCFTGNQSDAEDLTQEVFLRIIKALDTFQGHSQIKTWILGIAKNTAKEWYRKRHFTKYVSDFIFDNLTSMVGLPEQALHHKENQKIIAKALQDLKPAYRMVVFLRIIKEFSVKETAEILGCSEAKVKVDYHRALKKLHVHSQTIQKEGWLYGVAE